jgi:hypothetical protein
MALGLLLSFVLQAGAGAAAAGEVPWARTASAQDVADAYPAAAKAENLAGSGVIDCTVAPTGDLTGCTSVGTDAYGFGAAALGLAAKYQVAVNKPEGKAKVGGSVRLPVRWLNEAKLKAPPIIVYDDAQRSGTVALNCRVREDHKVDNCVALEVRPRGANLIPQAGEAALRQKAPPSAPAASRILLVVEMKAQR